MSRWLGGASAALAATFLFGSPHKADAGSVSLSWAASADSTVVGYKVYYGGAVRAYTNSTSVGNVTSYTISGLAPDKEYFFATTSVDGYGLESVFSNETSALVPGSANIVNGAGLAVVQSAPGTALLEWLAATTTGASITNYGIYYCVDNGFQLPGSQDYTNSINVGNVLVGTVSGLTVGDTYDFALAARDSLGNLSAFGPTNAITIQAAPAAPVLQTLANVATSPTTATETVGWSLVPGALGYVASVSQFTADGNTAWTGWQSYPLGPNATSFTFTGVPGINWSVIVQSTNNVCPSYQTVLSSNSVPYYTSAPATPTLAVTTDVATSSTNSNETLSWPLVAKATGYVITWAVKTNGAWPANSTTNYFDGNTTNFSFTIIPGFTYAASICSTNPVAWSAQSTPLTNTAAAYYTAAPAAPSGFVGLASAATSPTNATQTVAWGPTAKTTSYIAWVNQQVGNGNTNWTGYVSYDLSGSTTNFTLAGSPNAPWKIFVESVNPAGTSSPSIVYSGQFPAYYTSPPPVPTGLTVTTNNAVSPTVANQALGWNSMTNATSYNVLSMIATAVELVHQRRYHDQLQLYGSSRSRLCRRRGVRQPGCPERPVNGADEHRGRLCPADPARSRGTDSPDE
jgi:hypothetical protein